LNKTLVQLYIMCALAHLLLLLGGLHVDRLVKVLKKIFTRISLANWLDTRKYSYR